MLQQWVETGAEQGRDVGQTGLGLAKRNSQAKTQQKRLKLNDQRRLVIF